MCKNCLLFVAMFTPSIVIPVIPHNLHILFNPIIRLIRQILLNSGHSSHRSPTQEAINLGGCCNIIHPSKLTFNSNLAKTGLSLTSISYAQLFWNFSESTAVSLPCSVQNFKTVVQLWNKSPTNKILWEISFGGMVLYCNNPQITYNQYNDKGLIYKWYHWNDNNVHRNVCCQQSLTTDAWYPVSSIHTLS